MVLSCSIRAIRRAWIGINVIGSAFTGETKTACFLKPFFCERSKTREYYVFDSCDRKHGGLFEIQYACREKWQHIVERSMV